MMISKHLISNNKTFDKQFHSTNRSAFDEYPLTRSQSIPLSEPEFLDCISFQEILHRAASLLERPDKNGREDLMMKN
jgi:hypothetical protein